MPSVLSAVGQAKAEGWVKVGAVAWVRGLPTSFCMGDPARLPRARHRAIFRPTFRRPAMSPEEILRVFVRPGSVRSVNIFP